MKFKVQVDVASDCSINTLLELIENNSMEEETAGMKLIEVSGPGGGNPIFEFSHSSRIVVIRIAKEFLDVHDSEFINSIIEIE